MFLSIAFATLFAILGDDPATGELTIEDAQVTLLESVQIPAKEAGVLAELSVKEGNLVVARTEIGRLETDLPVSQQQLAKYEYAIARLRSGNDIDRRFAKKSLQVAETELERSMSSWREYPKSVSETELDRLRLVVEKSRLSIEQADRDLRVSGLTKGLKQQSMRIAGQLIERHRIVVPIDGMVVEVYRQPGEWLDPGDPVARVIRMNRLRVEAFVDGRRFGSNLDGCQVQLVTQLPPGDRTANFQGKIVFVSPEVQPVNGQVRVWAEIENPQLTLRPGTRGKLTVWLKDSRRTPDAVDATASVGD